MDFVGTALVMGAVQEGGGKKMARPYLDSTGGNALQPVSTSQGEGRARFFLVQDRNGG